MPLPASEEASRAHGCLHASSLCLYLLTAFYSCFLEGNLSLALRPLPINPGRFPLQILNLLYCAKTLFPNKVAITHSRSEDLPIASWGTTVRHTTLSKQFSSSSEVKQNILDLPFSFSLRLGFLFYFPFLGIAIGSCSTESTDRVPLAVSVYTSKEAALDRRTQGSVLVLCLLVRQSSSLQRAWGSQAHPTLSWSHPYLLPEL